MSVVSKVSQPDWVGPFSLHVQSEFNQAAQKLQIIKKLRFELRSSNHLSMEERQPQQDVDGRTLFPERRYETLKHEYVLSEPQVNLKLDLQFLEDTIDRVCQIWDRTDCTIQFGLTLFSPDGWSLRKTFLIKGCPEHEQLVE